MGLPPVQTQTVQTLGTPPRIHAARVARNGLVPSAALETQLASSLNFVCGIRGKVLGTWFSPIANIPTGVGSTRTRWRFAAHTSPFLRRLRCRVYLAHADTTGGGGGGSNPSVTIAVTNANESTTHGSETFSAGTFVGSPVDVPFRFVEGELIIGGVPADTDVYFRVDDTNGGRTIAVSIQEEMLAMSAANGYVVPAAVSISTPIYDARRELMLESATTAWKRQGAVLWQWTCDPQSSPFTINTGTFTNIIDSTTAVSAASCGATLDLRYNKTRSASTVPCRIYARAKMSAASDTGEVGVFDSAGVQVGASVHVSGSTESWYTLDLDMPDDLSKFDIMACNPDASETLSVYAVSVVQYAD